MAVDGVMMDAVVVESRKAMDPRVSTKFGLGVENERAAAGRDGRSCLREISYSMFCSADHEQGWQPYPVRLMPSLLYVKIIHRYTLSRYPVKCNSKAPPARLTRLPA